MFHVTFSLPNEEDWLITHSSIDVHVVIVNIRNDLLKKVSLGYTLKLLIFFERLQKDFPKTDFKQFYF